jgi:signal peptidase I
VQELIRTAIGYGLVLGMILLGFYLYRENRVKVEIDVSDHSMSPEYISGTYKIDTASPIAVGDAVAFGLPDKPDELRVSRVVALEGSRIEVDAVGKVTVDGKACRNMSGSTLKPLDFRVPRGCAYLLADSMGVGMDSSKLGPIPLFQIAGKLK